MIFRKVNICVIAAANLVYVERVLSEKVTNMVVLVFPARLNG